jgi:hypothetical protein
VPKRLERAFAELLGVGKQRQSWLKESLRTKDLREAKIRSNPILIQFDQLLGRTEGLPRTRPERTAASANAPAVDCELGTASCAIELGAPTSSFW